LSRLRRIILRSSKDEAAINHYLEELESIIDSLSKPVDYMQKKFLEESTTLPRTIRLRRRQLNLMDDPDSEGRGN
ncbi:hypothetical protein, partial [Klebsiella pneumoniae]